MPDYDLINPDGSKVFGREPWPLPAPRLDYEQGNLVIREGTLDDLDFVDEQQKAKVNRNRLGFLKTDALVGKVQQKRLLIAELREEGTADDADFADEARSQASALTISQSAPSAKSAVCARQRVGYLIAQDQYLRRGDLGLITQMAVAPGMRRSYVAAHLLRAQFDRSAYGCKLYCCWCAQDLDACRFWESMGFVALAFRTGSPREKVRRLDGSKGPRIHIFWQKKIRPRDTETAYWYPSETSGGAIGASRIVLPIPLGTHWSEAKPAVLPPELVALPPAPEDEPPAQEAASTKALTTGSPTSAEGAGGADGVGEANPLLRPLPGGGEQTHQSESASSDGVNGFGVGFGPSPEEVAAREAEAKRLAERAAVDAEAKKQRRVTKRKAERARLKTNDPALRAYSRELRDRWLEVTALGSEGSRLLDAQHREATYAVARTQGLEGRASVFLNAAESEPSNAKLDDGRENVRRLVA